MHAKRLLATLAASGLLVVACGDNDDTTADGDPTEATADPTEATTGDGNGAGADPVTITMEDYAYPDIPDTVDAGTTFTVDNVSDTEVHEFVAFRLPDDETRSVEELFQLPEEELEPLLDPNVVTVMFQAPGDDTVIPALGDGTLTEPGRYAIACFIPVGVPAEDFFAAAEAAGDGPPQLEGYGPPHFTQGMLAELTVE